MTAKKKLDPKKRPKSRRARKYERRMRRILKRFYPGPESLELITQDLDQPKDRFEMLCYMLEMAINQAEHEYPHATFH